MGAELRETGTEFRKNLRKGVYKRGGSVQNEEVCRMSQVGRRKGLTGDGKPE